MQRNLVQRRKAWPIKARTEAERLGKIRMRTRQPIRTGKRSGGDWMSSWGYSMLASSIVAVLALSGKILGHSLRRFLMGRIESCTSLVLLCRGNDYAKL